MAMYGSEILVYAFYIKTYRKRVVVGPEKRCSKDSILLSDCIKAGSRGDRVWLIPIGLLAQEHKHVREAVLKSEVKQRDKKPEVCTYRHRGNRERRTAKLTVKLKSESG